MCKIILALVTQLNFDDIILGCTECDFRLVNGTVYDQMWNDTDASVVYKQLGMSSTGSTK